MIVYFSGTGNSLSVARQLAELTNDKLMHLNMASATDFCPEQAIEIRGRNTLKEQQFHHPSVKAKDMFGVGMKSEKLL